LGLVPQYPNKGKEVTHENKKNEDKTGSQLVKVKQPAVLTEPPSFVENKNIPAL